MALRVSDHALVRFLERAGGYDVEPLRQLLEASLARAAAAARSIGVDEYLIHADGLMYVVRNETVTTIMDPYDPGARHRALGKGRP